MIILSYLFKNMVCFLLPTLILQRLNKINISSGNLDSSNKKI